MKELLREKIATYLVEAYPEVIQHQGSEFSIREMINDYIKQVSDLIEQQATLLSIMDIIISEIDKKFGPSRYNYLATVFGDNFHEEYVSYHSRGVLRYVLLSILEESKSVFEDFGFGHENPDSSKLQNALIYEIHSFIHKKT